MNRKGFIEETYFTFSYSPVRDDEGGIGGVLVTCQETTADVQSERRLDMPRSPGSSRERPQLLGDAERSFVELGAAAHFAPLVRGLLADSRMTFVGP